MNSSASRLDPAAASPAANALSSIVTWLYPRDDLQGAIGAGGRIEGGARPDAAGPRRPRLSARRSRDLPPVVGHHGGRPGVQHVLAGPHVFGKHAERVVWEHGAIVIRVRSPPGAAGCRNGVARPRSGTAAMRLHAACPVGASPLNQMRSAIRFWARRNSWTRTRPARSFESPESGSAAELVPSGMPLDRPPA